MTGKTARKAKIKAKRFWGRLVEASPEFKRLVEGGGIQMPALRAFDAAATDGDLGRARERWKGAVQRILEDNRIAFPGLGGTRRIATGRSQPKPTKAAAVFKAAIAAVNPPAVGDGAACELNKRMHTAVMAAHGQLVATMQKKAARARGRSTTTAAAREEAIATHTAASGQRSARQARAEAMRAARSQQGGMEEIPDN